ncbi:hypothetical protein RRX38_17540 [Pseudomonas sp. DTU_2021_1001937_2_SI_NGA_ILE_001]|uniref:hypothetical protein n=1 Tax=Pseudomonas sp. DTU_2021_1001937_2_SI_NGA_ILE_001 TaxID=3077589 RepID=UPI0028FC251B|nr:hypothetical protein [Pseudomonas sp. DTU_2021_1001937_2_SI_NGA_ILE_001]WNW12878.1 hypothetical protein RRX38_17540 [Pseudomonas sp. DTU_2021_1001937_2_SI_NGA_ILE_001]
MAEPDSPQYTKLPNGGPRVMPLPLVIPDAHRLAQPDPTPAPAPSFEKPAPRERLQPEPVADEEPGFYILPRSMTPAELYRELFDDMPGTALRSFSQIGRKPEDLGRFRAMPSM